MRERNNTGNTGKLVQSLSGGGCVVVVLSLSRPFCELACR